MNVVVQSFPTLCNPMDCSTPGFPVLHHLPEFAQTHCPLSWWCHPVISSSVAAFSCCLQPFPASGSLPMSQKRWLLAAGCQSIGSSASASVLPMNIQGWLLCVGRGKSLGSLKSFLSRASQQGRASFLCFTYSEVPWGCSLMVRNLRYSSPSWVPLGLRSSHLRAATTDDCYRLVYWQGRKFSFSQYPIASWKKELSNCFCSPGK